MKTIRNFGIVLLEFETFSEIRGTIIISKTKKLCLVPPVVHHTSLGYSGRSSKWKIRSIDASIYTIYFSIWRYFYGFCIFQKNISNFNKNLFFYITHFKTYFSVYEILQYALMSAYRHVMTSRLNRHHHHHSRHHQISSPSVQPVKPKVTRIDRHRPCM